MTKKFKLLIVALATAVCATAQQTVNDINTPLHEMKPEYGFFYGVPKREEVKSAMDKVLSFLEENMPAETENGKLKQGGFRMTSYEMGVLYSAVQDAALYTGDARYLDFNNKRLQLIADLAPQMYEKVKADRYYDRQMRLMIMPGSLDESGAMCAAYCRMQMAHPYKPYDGVIRTLMNRVWKQYRMGDDKILARHRPYQNSVWLDDMYMGITPLAWYGCFKQDTSSIKEAVNQIKAFRKRMWIPEERFFRHGWVDSFESHPCFPWARANGWAILTMCQVLDAMQLNHENLAAKGVKDYAGYEADRGMILDLLRQHIEGLCQRQDKTGLWHQLLDDTDSYLETSATAIYTYCLAHAICEGWIDAKVYGPRTLLAWNAVSTQISEKGEVKNVCVGTGMGFDKAFYCYRPVHVMAAHGYGPVIWAGGEIIRLLEVCNPKVHDSAVLF